MSTEQLLESVAERLRSSASVKTLYGEPVVAAGKTIIPVAKVAYGFGGGTGTKKQAEGKEPAAGEGAGAGGGVTAKPTGVVEITPEQTRYVPFGLAGKLTAAAAAGLALGLLIGTRRSKS